MALCYGFKKHSSVVFDETMPLSEESIKWEDEGLYRNNNMGFNRINRNMCGCMSVSNGAWCC